MHSLSTREIWHGLGMERTHAHSPHGVATHTLALVLYVPLMAHLVPTHTSLLARLALLLPHAAALCLVQSWPDPEKG